MTMQLKDMRLLKRNGYIDGRWVDADSGASFRVTDPASGQTIDGCVIMQDACGLNEFAVIA